MLWIHGIAQWLHFFFTSRYLSARHTRKGCQVPQSTYEGQHVHCIYCWSPSEFCICGWADRIVNQLPVHIFMHHKEASRRSNSAHLLMMSLKNVRLDMHGVKHQPTQWPSDSTPRPLCVLFPSEDATELTPNDRGNFDRLIVLDGNWRQAKKAANRIAKACQPIFKTLPLKAPSEFRLRQQSDVGRLSSFEATARALSILENITYEERMMPLFRAHVRVTMEARSRRGWHRQNSQST